MNKIFDKAWDECLTLWKDMSETPDFQPLQNIADFNRGCVGYVCEKLFNTAKRIDGITKDQRKRDRKYPPYIRLRHVPFEFIIENCILKTVEICVKDFRHLNKVKINGNYRVHILK